MRYGPSTNTLMTADEYARLDRIRAHALMSSVSRTLPAWSDESTPRTDRPVRFYPKGRPAPYPGPTDVCVEQAYGTSFRVSDAIRVF